MQYYSGKGIKLSWPKAVEFCQKYNMVLAELPTEKDQTDFLNLITQQRGMFFNCLLKNFKLKS